jgi:hypothetical protein
LSRRVVHYELRQPLKDQQLGARLMVTSQQYPRFGYRRTAAWLDEGLCRVPNAPYLLRQREKVCSVTL